MLALMTPMSGLACNCLPRVCRPCWDIILRSGPASRPRRSRAQAHQLAESAGAMRGKLARQAVFEVLAAGALRYGGLEAVAGALAAALARHEHLAVALAELAEFAEAKVGDSRLVRPPRSASGHNCTQPARAHSCTCAHFAPHQDHLSEGAPHARWRG